MQSFYNKKGVFYMKKYKIMIVDDDPTSLAIGRALLEDEYELTLAYSGVQALGFMKGNYMPDLILLDMVMQGLGGMEVLSELKNSKHLCNIPVIFLTGESSPEEEVNCYRKGASEFLMKPVNPEMLRIKISRQLSYIKLKQENDQLKAGIKGLKDQFDIFFPPSLTEK